MHSTGVYSPIGCLYRCVLADTMLYSDCWAEIPTNPPSSNMPELSGVFFWLCVDAES